MKILDLTLPMKLTNDDGVLELIPLGIGGAFDNSIRGNNNWLIRKGDTHVLIDMSNITLHVLTDLTGIEFGGIKYILPTHAHADHTGGIETYAQDCRYRKQWKPTMIITSSFQQLLWNETLKGGLGYNEGEIKHLEDYFTVINPVKKVIDNNIMNDSWDIVVGDIKLTLIRSSHFCCKTPVWHGGARSYSLIIDDKIYYSSDSCINDNMIKNSSDYEAIFHEVSSKKSPVHTYLQDYIIATSTEIRDKTVFMHYDEDCLKYKDELTFAEKGKVYRSE